MSWQNLPFDQVAVAQSDKGRRIKQRDYLPAGAIPVIDQGQEAVGGYTDDAALVFDGALPVILFGDHTRAVKLVSQPFAVGADGIKIFRPAVGVQPKYLYYWMKSAPIPDRGYGRHYQYLRKLVVPVPAPASQDGVVAEIEKQFSRLDEAVAGLKRVKANLKRYKAAVLKAAVEGRLVPTEADLARREGRSYETGAQLLQRILETRRSQWQGKKAYREPMEPRDGWVRSNCDSWAVASLESITSANRVICYGILMPKENVADGVLYVKVRDIKDDRINVKALHRTTQAIAASYARASLQAGDLLLSIRGTFGRVATVPPALDGGNITQDTVRLAVIPLVRAEYLAIFLRSDGAQKYFKAIARGVAVKGVNVGDLRPMAIPLPSLPEQHRIVAEVDRRLSIVREVEAEVEANLKRAQALRQAVLARSFQVPQA
ncbi:MAG: restriction endonuclease subunit S [Rhodocyclales bacterium]|nr:restriction endonuclease subunit S [Rhodocyclales bacterium]